MLVIISDLHFTDATTSNKVNGQDISNVNPRAFKRFLGEVANIVQSRNSYSNPPISKVTFIYNGDIFDPLRSDKWFSASVKEQPWREPNDQTATLGLVRQIMDDIITHNAEALQWLSGTHPDFDSTWPDGVEIERIYIPGNHDRMVNLDQSLRMQVYKTLLNKPRSKKMFDNYILDSEHRTLIMHGHEADTFNCEHDENGNPIYNAQAIGDAMTTMLFSAIGHESQGLSISQAAKKRFRDIEHVRPHLVGVSYLQDIIKDFPKSRSLIGNMVKKIVDDFQDLDFYKEWTDKHDKWNIGLDEADKLQDALRVIKLLGTRVPAGLLEKIAGFFKDTTYTVFAERQLKTIMGQKADFCVFGHTHEPKHVPLFIDKNNDREKHYLNTGTFRLNLGRTHNMEDFLRFQRLCFVVVYGPEEFKSECDVPVYELWSGLRRFV